MASESQCDAAFREMAERLAALPPEVRRKYVVERTVSCRVSDLGTTWSARLCADEGICDLTQADTDKAQVRFTVGSDDLLALSTGELGIGTAVALGKLRVTAGPLDLLKLRQFL